MSGGDTLRSVQRIIERVVKDSLHHTAIGKKFALVGLAALVFAACGRARTDDNLMAVFSSNEKWFDEIASAYDAGRITCPYRNDPEICLISGARGALLHLSHDARVQEVYVKRNRGYENGVWFPVETYGFLSTDTQTRGYVYLDDPPGMTVQDTLEKFMVRGSFFKPVKGHWYLYAVD